jgi:hypothetical protein
MGSAEDTYVSPATTVDMGWLVRTQFVYRKYPFLRRLYSIDLCCFCFVALSISFVLIAYSNHFCSARCLSLEKFPYSSVA